MAEIVSMPKLGFDMKEGTLVRWVKQEGEAVAKGDVLAEIETDKATVEVESHFAGFLFKQLVEANAIVPIGDPIAVISEKDEKVDIESLLGARVESSAEPVNTVETSNLAEIQEDAQINKVNSDQGRVIASPLARKIAMDNELSLAKVRGSGPGGRIVKKDVELVLKSELQPTDQDEKQKPESEKNESRSETSFEGIALPSAVWQGENDRKTDQKIPLNKLRQAISRRMADSKQNIPHFYVTRDYKVDNLMTLYQDVNRTLPKNQFVSINDFVIKATALTLREYPNLNSSIEGSDLVQHGNINIGVAVGIEGGLLTIVVKDADRKPIRVISQEVKEMAARVRSGKIKPEDVDGSTFSISNLGMYEVDNFAAIINPPESAILAVSSARKTAIVEGEVVSVGWRMKMTLSADHRATDGVEAAQFMKALAFQLDNPLRLLL